MKDKRREYLEWIINFKKSLTPGNESPINTAGFWLMVSSILEYLLKSHPQKPNDTL